MQRCRKAVFDHFFFFEDRKSRVQLFEVVEVFKDCFYNIVNDVRIGCGLGHEGRADTEGLNVVRVTAIHAARNGGNTVIRVIGNQFVYFRTGNFDQNRITGRYSFLNRTGRMTNDIKHRIDLVIAKRLLLFSRLQFGCQCEIVKGPALGVHHDFNGVAATRTRVTDIDTFAFKVIKGFDAGISAGNNGERLRMDREDGTKFRERADVFECFFTIKGIVLNVRLGNAKIQLARTNGVDVVGRTTSGLDRATNAMLFTVFVHQTADCTTCRIVNARHATGTDGDKTVFLCRCLSG